MLLKIIILLLTVWQVLAVTPFVEEGIRAKIFELTDNEVPAFKITVPEDKLSELIEEAQVSPDSHKNNIEKIIKMLNGEPVEEEEKKPKLKIKDASLVVEINGEKKTFNKVTFSLGGTSARLMSRQGFNVKIRGKDNLYGRSHFRLRPDAHEATYLRSKLACDIHNRLGLESVSANYATLYINDKYYGFYVLLDAPKLTWVEEKYDDKDTPYLYKCKSGGCFLSQNCAYICQNENDEITDNSELMQFLRKLDKAKSAEEIEDIFDIEKFLYETAYEYLSGAWDHLLHGGHNFSIYKQKNGKWTIIYYDFDSDLGQDPVGVEYGIVNTNPDKDFPSYTFDEWMSIPIHLLDILVYKNQDHFKEIMNRFVTEAFNPNILYPHIDELKKFIRPYVEYDKTPGENGLNPGVINLLNTVEYTLEEWNVNSEFTTISRTELNSSAYGIKYWILARYRTVCETFDIECDPVYLDENYEYPVDKDMEGVIDLHRFDGHDFTAFKGGNPYYQRDSNDTFVYTISPSKPTQTQTTIVEPTQTEVISNAEPTSTQDSKYKCLSELVGYPCCAKGIKVVYAKDEYGEWGYDFKKNEWCGLTPYEERVNEEECWSEKYGYPCCNGCYVFETDDDGQWGYENNQWCGIQSFCSN